MHKLHQVPLARVRNLPTSQNANWFKSTVLLKMKWKERVRNLLPSIKAKCLDIHFEMGVMQTSHTGKKESTTVLWAHQLIWELKNYKNTRKGWKNPHKMIIHWPRNPPATPSGVLTSQHQHRPPVHSTVPTHVSLLGLHCSTSADFRRKLLFPKDTFSFFFLLCFSA